MNSCRVMRPFSIRSFATVGHQATAGDKKISTRVNRRGGQTFLSPELRSVFGEAKEMDWTLLCRATPAASQDFFEMLSNIEKS